MSQSRTDAPQSTAAASQASVRSEELSYCSADGGLLHAYHAWDEALAGPRPGVLVVHEWWGLNDYARRRARELAALGYNALAIDMYGEGRSATSMEGARELMQAALASPPTLRERFLAGLEQLRQQAQTDTRRLAAIGYCFGGRVVLDMARQGVPLAGVVSFHGLLGTATPAMPGSVQAKVLVQHGDADSLVSAEDVARFEAEMHAAGADYRVRHHADAPHAFSNPGSPGYQQAADRNSWADMQAFFAELFGRA